MLITGIHKDYDVTDGLNQISVPMVFVCAATGQPDPRRPPGTTA